MPQPPPARAGQFLASLALVVDGLPDVFEFFGEPLAVAHRPDLVLDLVHRPRFIVLEQRQQPRQGRNDRVAVRAALNRQVERRNGLLMIDRLNGKPGRRDTTNCKHQQR